MHAADIEGRVVVVAFLLVVAYFYVPPSGEYRLKPGHAACPTKQNVVEYRGARMLGIWAQARVIAARNCVTGSRPFRVIHRSTWLDLPYRINWGGVVMYADHDAIEEI